MELSVILDFVIKGVLALSQLALFIYVRNENRNDKTNERITKTETAIKKLDDDITDQLTDHGQKIAALTVAGEHGPTHHDLGLLHEKVNDVDGKVSNISGQLDGIETNVRLIMNRIMERGLP